MISPVLKARLRPLARRQRRLEFWKRLAICWLLCAAGGLALLVLQELGGWSSSLTLPLVLAAGVVAAVVTLVRHRRRPDDWRELARQIEARHPELEGVLLTAVQQEADPHRGLGFLQERVLFEALQHAGRSRWVSVVPRGRVLAAQAGQWLALAAFGFVAWTLRPTGEVKFAIVRSESGITVTPGDTSLERGSSLVVMARFGEAPASGAELVLVGATAEASRRLPLVKSLDDPVFGGSVPEVTSDLVYRVEFGSERTRDFKVTVFEFPKLERSDVDIHFPEFTGQPVKRLENTRRVSAVEGSLLDVTLQFNKPVAAARLVGRDTNRTEVPLLVATNQPAAVLTGFALQASRTYDLQLVDADGRTNKVPAQFVFDALKNRAPELRITSPRGDTRPSPLEELTFEGTVWDDFGVLTYGFAYTVAGGETAVVELGAQVPARDKRAFRHVLPLEPLGVQTDDLLSWYVWADDRGPDGAVRRTTSDLFFGEVRAFDEIFREGQGMAGGEQGGEQGEAGGEQGSPSAKLAELQKQIINATWRLLRDKGATAPAREGQTNPKVERRSPGETQSLNTNGPWPDPWSGARADVTRVGQSGMNPFPLTLALSLGEREATRPGAAGSVAFDIRWPQGKGSPGSGGEHGRVASSRERPIVFPLPKGEGQGEGEQRAQPTQRPDHPEASAAGGLVHRAVLATEARPAVGVADLAHRGSESRTGVLLLAMPATLPTRPSVPRAAPVFAQAAPSESPPAPSAPRARRTRSGGASPGAEPPRVNFAEDAGVVRDSQAEALDQAEAARDEAEDPRTAALWEAASQQMEKALARLKAAPDSPEALREALAAEQAAYQALLKLQEREYSVSRNRSRQQQRGNQSGRQQQMQQQLDQLELTQSENRYETQSQARAPQSPERGEQLQVLNRLQELARRQEDLNERLQELQTALQAAQTEQEREEIRRELKRLQEEQQQMMADVDELQQRMDRPENQSRMSEQRQQLEQARQEMQRSAEAAREGSVSQALASGTRAQRQMQEMQDQLRRESAGEFAEDLRQMREEARELTRRQTEIQQQVDALAGNERKTLTDAGLREELLQQLEAQKARLTNLVGRATQLSEQAEQSEPLVSTELYDALRKFSQSDAGTAKDFQEELLNRGMLTQRLLNRLQETERSDGAKSLEVTAEMLRQGYLPQADQAEQRARTGIAELTRGVERAADRVLGDDAEALRLAREQLDDLSQQVEREAAQAEARQQADERRSGSAAAGESTTAPGSAGEPRPNEAADPPAGGQSSSSTATGEQASTPPGDRPPTRAAGEPTGDRPQSGNQTSGARPTAPEANGERPATPPGQRPEGAASPEGASQRGERQSPGSPGGQSGGAQRSLLDQFLDGFGGGTPSGPITGEDFAPWADRLREVEEMVGQPELRTEIARARERARQLRQEFRRNQQRPDWAVVRLEVVRPLVEVRERITEELARRAPGDKLVPIDRDPVPSRYSELVRRYYEELGKDR